MIFGDTDNAIVIDAHRLIDTMRNELPFHIFESVMELLKKIKLNTIANSNYEKNCKQHETEYSHELIYLVRDFDASYNAASQYIFQYVNK